MVASLTYTRLLCMSLLFKLTFLTWGEFKLNIDEKSVQY